MRVIARDGLKTHKGISYSHDHLRRMERAGLFPKSFPLGPGRVAYDERDIDDWLDCRKRGQVWTPSGQAA